MSRLRLIWAALRGRSIAYNFTIHGGALDFTGHRLAYIDNVTLTSDQVDYNLKLPPDEGWRMVN